eukprot:NODE_6974_length_271_cov_239.144144_g6362_i0.p3 GENE.NODE_6974_length_271_cov_239.144144_g6362_i0~~NODE_6974_length_271_cov_239.144144_g6362_i0.p3  ORF type:complete len:50 (+),score=22.98 NODE_6974_length_271_cov_239.144144_g6362_i0:29-151(+)
MGLQPGSESDEVLRLAEEKGIPLIHGGPCVLRTSMQPPEP